MRRFFRWLGTTPGLVAAAVLLVLAFFRPDIIQTALFNLVAAIFTAVGPVLGPLLIFVIIFIGLRIILRGLK